MKSKLTTLPELKYIIRNYPEDNAERIFKYFLHLQESGIKIVE